MKNQCIFILALTVILGSVHSSFAQPQYFAGTGHYYERINVSNGISWADARDEAHCRGGHLASFCCGKEFM